MTMYPFDSAHHVSLQFIVAGLITITIVCCSCSEFQRLGNHTNQERESTMFIPHLPEFDRAIVFGFAGESSSTVGILIPEIDQKAPAEEFFKHAVFFRDESELIAVKEFLNITVISVLDSGEEMWRVPSCLTAYRHPVPRAPIHPVEIITDIDQIEMSGSKSSYYRLVKLRGQVSGSAGLLVPDSNRELPLDVMLAISTFVRDVGEAERIVTKAHGELHVIGSAAFSKHRFDSEVFEPY